MTISVNGYDPARTTQGRTYIATGAWAAQDSQLAAGHLALTFVNHWNRSPLAPLTRLLTPPPYLKTISGTVTQDGTPCARIVRCYRRSDGELAGENTSDPTTGAYQFTGLAADQMYFCVAHDDLDLAPDYNALTFDLLEPGP